MKQQQSRLDRIFKELTGKERAILLLQSMKAGEEHDPFLTMFVPPEALPELNRLFAIIKTVNGGLVSYLGAILGDVRFLHERAQRLVHADIAARAAELALQFLRENVREPITQSDYAALLKPRKPSQTKKSRPRSKRGSTFEVREDTAADEIDVWRAEYDQLVKAVIILEPPEVGYAATLMRAGAECNGRIQGLRRAIRNLAPEFDGESPACYEVESQIDGLEDELIDLRRYLEGLNGCEWPEDIEEATAVKEHARLLPQLLGEGD